jgi:protein-S-isoprenylcysteine O-methyltransferase Ste14
VAAVLARARVPLGFVCGAIVMWLARPTMRSLVTGGLVAIAGEAIRIWASGHLEKGSEVTQSGPYRLTRHPLYAGSALVAVGTAVASAHAAAAAIVVGYVVITIVAAIRHEESNMRATFGDGYDAYAQSRAQPVARSFSVRRAIKNKEHKAVAGLLAVAAILAAKAALR